MENTRPGRLVWLLAGSATLAALVLYGSTAAPDLTLVDSGELALACVNAAPAHPPGFPLYVLVGHLFTLVPLATPIRMLNLMSAGFSALAVGALFLVTERALTFWRLEAPRRSALGPNAAWTGALVAAVAFATSRNTWTWSSVTEVYAFNIFLVLAAWACAWFAVVALQADDSPKPGTPPDRWITLACLAATAGLAVHHATAALLLPVLVWMLLRAAPGVRRNRRLWFSLGAGFGLVAVSYLWLLPASRRDPGLGWGGIDSLALLARHVTGSQYRSQLASAEDQPMTVAGEFFSTLIEGCSLPVALLVVVALAGFAFSGRTGRGLRAALGPPLALLGLNLLLSVLYVAGPEDRMAYDLPATAAWCILAGAGAALVLRRVPPKHRIAAAAGLALVIAGWNVRSNFDLCDLSRDNVARTHARESLDSLPEGSVVFTAEWNLYAPYLYLRHVEGYRRDLAMVDVLMLRRFWYFDYLEREYPALVEASRSKFDAFRAQATDFDLGKPYDAGRIQGLYEALMLSWVDRGRRQASSQVDWASLQSAQEASWIRRRSGRLAGLLVELVGEGAPPDAGSLPPMDASNLGFLRSRITTRSLSGDLTDLVPRHLPYWKIWRNYQSSVETSLRIASGIGPEAVAERARAYADWYPEVEAALAPIDAR